MGIIQKQAVRTTTVIFAGLGVGLIARMLMPFVLSEEQIGVWALIESVSNLFAAIFCLGFVQVTHRMFPFFKNEQNGHNGYFAFGLIVSLVGIILGTISYFLLRPLIFQEAGEIEPLVSLSILVVPMLAFRILFKNFDMYMRMLLSSVLGAFLESFLVKLLLLLALLFFWAQLYDFNSMIIAFAVVYSLPGLLIVFSAIRITPKVTMPTSEIFDLKYRGDLARNTFFGLVISASGILVLTIDQIMMASMLSVKDVGVYSILFFAGMVVAIPAKGLKRISVPLLGEAFRDNNTQELRDIYSKSSLIGIVSGGFLLVVGWACLDSVLFYLPNYQYGKYVFLFIGVAQLVEISTGVNQELIGTSEKFHMNTYVTLTMGVSVVGFNLLLIPMYGVVGAAIASCAAFVVVNILRWYLVWRAFGISPYQKNTLWILALLILFFAIGSWAPLQMHPILNIAIYIVFFTATYWGIVYRSNLVPDINALILKIKRRILP